MESIKSIGLIFCICSVVFGVILLLIPSGKYEKSLKTVVGLLMLVIIFSVVGKNLDFDFDFSIDQEIKADSANSLTQASERQILTLAENRIRQQISQLLDSKGVKDYKIEIIMDNSGTNGISISKAEIYLKDVNADVVELVYRNLGIRCEVLRSEGAKAG